MEKYTITDKDFIYYINGISIPDEIFEEAHYGIENREDFIDTLIDWISEASGSNKQLMKDDLFMLSKIDDKYILSSKDTNDYLYGNSEEFNNKCEEILELVKQ